MLTSSLPIPVIPPPSIIPSSVSTAPESAASSVANRPSSDLAIFYPSHPSTSSLPVIHNSHSMVTRSKHGIYISLKPY